VYFIQNRIIMLNFYSWLAWLIVNQV